MKQARLAQACFADDRHHLPMALMGPCAHARELLHFDAATDKARQPPGSPHLEAGWRGRSTNKLIHRRLIPTVVARRLSRFYADMPLSKPQRVGADKQSPGPRNLSEAGGGIRGVAHRPALRAQSAPDPPDHHLPGVQPGANPDCGSRLRSRPIGIALYGLLHL